MITDKTSCARTACDKPARFGVDVYCSDDCRLIHTRVKALPTTGSGGSMHQTRGAAVGFAWSWLDARAQGLAKPVRHKPETFAPSVTEQGMQDAS